MSNTKTILSVAEVALQLGVSQQTVRRLIHGGILPAKRNTLIKRARFVIQQADLDAYLAELAKTS